MSIRRLALTTLLLALPLAAQAQIPFLNPVLETCSLQGTYHFSGPTQILCLGDLRIDPDTTILTEGGLLQIVTSGNIYFGAGSDGHGLTIHAAEIPLGTSQLPSDIEIHATTAFGYLQIEDQQQGGQIALNYVSLVKSYDQDLNIDPTTGLTANLNGNIVDLQGPSHKFP